MPFRRLSRGRIAGEQGQGLVEFALVLPLFLVLLFALVDFGRGFQTWIEVTNAAREGARVGAVGGTTSEIEARARAAAAGLDQTDLAISSTGVGGTPGSSVVVTATYSFELVTPLSPLLTVLSGGTLDDTLTLSSSADMRLE